jgi:methylmalonyl-CoA mutase N-terminal domain/subunit
MRNDFSASPETAAPACRHQAAIAGAAKDGVNLMPLIVDAARDYVTLGEMCAALREVWGV